MKRIIVCAQVILLTCAVSLAMASNSHNKSDIKLKKSKRVDCTSCTGPGKKCINNVCETGDIVYTESVLIGTNPIRFRCVYHYEWSDGTVSRDMIKTSPSACPT
jgi:hypothetical protein